jgi:hypothetical protein
MSRTMWVPAVLAAVVAGSAWSCGPSSGGADGGTSGMDGGESDTGSGSMDGGGGGDSTTGGDSSIGADSAGGMDSGLACPPNSTSTYKTSTYVPAVAHQGLCTAQAISDFVTACGDQGTNATCSAWQAANVAGASADGGGAGNACGNCIFAPQNNGATWVDPEAEFLPNFGACIQLSDPTHGTACATAYDNAGGCEAVACDNACPTTDTNPADFQACVVAADMGSCNTYASSEETACSSDFTDGGVADMCNPGAATGTMNPAYTLIAGLVCGEASDGGTTDSGTTDSGTTQDSGTADSGEVDSGAHDSGEADTGTVQDSGTILDTGTAAETGAGGCGIPNGSYTATSYGCGGGALMAFPAGITWVANYQSGSMSSFTYTVEGCSQIEMGPSSCTNGVLEVDDTNTSCSPAACEPFQSGGGCSDTIGAFYWDVSQVTATTFMITSINQPDGGPTPIQTCTGSGMSNPIQVLWTKM